MILIKQNEIIIKRSKFIGYLYQIDNLDEIKEILLNLRKEHKKAKHFPYAYKFNDLIKKSDDKEPTNTAGSPILNILMQNNLNNTLIVVVRYFGHIKLGVGGLTRAYLNTAATLINEKTSC